MMINNPLLLNIFRSPVRLISVRNYQGRFGNKPAFVDNTKDLKEDLNLFRRDNSTENSQQDTASDAKSDSLGQLQGILSNMKIDKGDRDFYSKLKKYGNSGMFDYATNKRYNRDDLKRADLQNWLNLERQELRNALITIPLNGFEELIQLTEDKKLWRFPIDNEQGLEEEQSVSFEEHVFLQEHLKEFSNNEYIQTFMGLVLSGLSKNYWMTAGRKQEVVKFFKDYFEEKREVYKERGLEI